MTVEGHRQGRRASITVQSAFIGHDATAQCGSLHAGQINERIG